MRRVLPTASLAGSRQFGVGASTLPNFTSNFDLTHAVTNQPSPMTDVNLFFSSPRYVSAVAQFSKDKETAARHKGLCEVYGAIAGSNDMLHAAHVSNKITPTFAAFDRYGRRGPGQAEFHPSYHSLMGVAVSHRVPSLAWVEDDAFVTRSVPTALHYQLEQGTSCPLTMTFAGVAPLKRALTKAKEGSDLHSELSLWIDKLTSTGYDSRDLHISKKTGVTIGMSMTEKQGGSDVRANTTVATAIGSDADSDSVPSYYTLRGHKWFTSAPMCDAFLPLAQVPKTSSSEGGLTCFLIPRWIKPDQYNMGLQFQRLKEKLGDKSNASSEVEYHDAVGLRIGSVGQGVKTIIEMVNLTRLDCLCGSGALLQRSALEAAHHAGHRSAFGARLIDQPLMQNVLCDLAIEAEAATALGMRISSGFNAIAAVNNAIEKQEKPSAELQQEAHFARLAVAISKYFVCKRAPAVVYEAMECLGGNGYTEDFPLSRLFRQSPLNAIWEGSGNVIVLDVFRAAQKEKEAVNALRHEFAQLLKKDKRLIKAVTAVDDAFKFPLDQQVAEGRRTVELMAKLLQASALFPAEGRSKEIETTEALIYDAFVETRLLDESGRRCDLLGSLPKKHISKSIIDRIVPRK
eukprot:GILI01019954.1.p1 GENE.GILI01019954.1~~GILI01019954.1.p1  ORF type:complete len:641 (+),score=99.66 GILI01019954.1:39-1925(+)